MSFLNRSLWKSQRELPENVFSESLGKYEKGSVHEFTEVNQQSY